MAERWTPSVEQVTRRLAETPRSFLGDIVVGAVLADVLADRGHDRLPPDWHAALAGTAAGAEPTSWVRSAGLLAWLLADAEIGSLITTRSLLELVRGDLHTLADHVSPADLIGDPERREELARLFLRAAGVIPAGETPEQATDRLATLDTATRLRVIAEARAAEGHVRKVREALARKRAQEAAAKATRE